MSRRTAGGGLYESKESVFQCTGSCVAEDEGRETTRKRKRATEEKVKRHDGEMRKKRMRKRKEEMGKRKEKIRRR